MTKISAHQLASGMLVVVRQLAKAREFSIFCHLVFSRKDFMSKEITIKFAVFIIELKKYI